MRPIEKEVFGSAAWVIRVSAVKIGLESEPWRNFHNTFFRLKYPKILVKSIVLIPAPGRAADSSRRQTRATKHA